MGILRTILVMPLVLLLIAVSLLMRPTVFGAVAIGFGILTLFAPNHGEGAALFLIPFGVLALFCEDDR